MVFVAKFSTYILGTVFAPRDHDFKNLVATLENRPKECGPSEVDQFAHGSYLSAKAWNSRVLLEWLNDCSRKAALNELPGVGESCLLMLFEHDISAGFCHVVMIPIHHCFLC